MTLEQEAWKAGGGAGSTPATPRPPTFGDRAARFAATILLLAIFAVSVWALSFVTVAPFLIAGAMGLALVHLFFKVRDLAREVRALRAELEAARPPPAEAKAQPPV